MDSFLTWEVFKDYTTFVSIVFSIVAVTKNVWVLKNVPTRLWSIIVSFTLLLLVNAQRGTFELWDLIIYLINGVIISMTANGLADMNTKKEDVDL